MKMKRGKKKALSVFNRFSGLPKLLIWGWTIWSVCIVATLLFLYAPPLLSVKEYAISLISSFTNPDKEIQPEIIVGPAEKSNIRIVDRHPDNTKISASQVSSVTTPNEQIQPDTIQLLGNKEVATDQNQANLSELPGNQRSPAPALSPKEGALTDTQLDLGQEESDDTALPKTPSIDSTIIDSNSADLRFFRNHPDSASNFPRGETKNSDIIAKTTGKNPILESDIIKTASIDLKFFRTHPDAVSSRTARDAVKINKVKGATSTDPRAGLTTDEQTDTIQKISDSKAQPEILLVEQKQPVATLNDRDLSKHTEDTPAVDLVDRSQIPNPKNDSPVLLPKKKEVKPKTKEARTFPVSQDTDRESENIAQKKVKNDIERFKTYDWREQSAEWEKLKFKGTDDEGRVVEMVLLVLSEKFYWQFGGQSVIKNDGQSIRITDHLASTSLKTAINESKGIISIGTASEEGDLQLEEYRANQRAERLMSSVIQTQPQINAIYTLSLGQYQKTVSTNTDKGLGPSSNDQRRIILISITHQDFNANLAEAVKDGLSNIPVLPYELGHFSHFELKNKASSF